MTPCFCWEEDGNQKVGLLPSVILSCIMLREVPLAQPESCAVLFNVISVVLCTLAWGNTAYGIEHLQVSTHAVTLELPILISATPSGGFPGGSVVKNLPAMQEMLIWSPGWEDPLEKGMTTHSSIFAWEIPWTEEPGGLQSKGLQKSWTWLSD